MSTSPSVPVPPAWVHKRDGRLVPFEADKISRALFAATEELGKPDAFLARELTDGVVHFLTAETEGTIPTTSQIADLTSKIVRELGQPALAQAFAHFTQSGTHEEQSVIQTREVSVRFSVHDTPLSIAQASLRDYSLQTIFARDLVAAQRDGLLTLTGLETPLELAGDVLREPTGTTPSGPGLVEAIEKGRTIAGGYLAIDSPEYTLLQSEPQAQATLLRAWVRELGIGLRATRLRAIVNLNCGDPPAWAGGLADGPLFAGGQQVLEANRLSGLADSLLAELLTSSALPLRVDWHLGEKDFGPEAEQRLVQVASYAARGDPVAFTLDRSRRDIALAEGIDRRHPAVLLAVGLHLPALAHQVLGSAVEPASAAEEKRSAQSAHAKVFLQKLGSLARLALSAAMQKRDFLRRHHEARPELIQGFLLDRARLVVIPIGLEATVRSFLGRGLCTGGGALELARQIVQRLRDVLRDDGGRCQLDTILDGGMGYHVMPFTGDRPAHTDEWPVWSREGLPIHAPEYIAGLTCWDVTAPVKSQLRTGTVLHAVTGSGTVTVLLPADHELTAQQIIDCLRQAWQYSDLVRVRFLREVQPPRQLALVT